MQPLRIAIIGAGFSGTALAAALYRAGKVPCEIILLDKTGRFGAGDAYCTPYPFHLLNVRACDMSAFEDEPDHYVNWLSSNEEVKPYLDKTTPIASQFTSRIFYGAYLKHLLQVMQQADNPFIKLRLEPADVIDLNVNGKTSTLILKDGRSIKADKVVIAMGNHSMQHFPFPVADNMKCIRYSWDYHAPNRIRRDDPVMIVGTGLTMIDTVLTLYHQGHRGKIYAVSRHGLLPLQHADSKTSFTFDPDDTSPDIRALTKWLRHHSAAQAEAGGDWRSVINAVRTHIPAMWSRISIPDKQRFMRHLAPYWNIHRHRVTSKVADTLRTLMAQEQLTVLGGYILSVDSEEAVIRTRKKNDIIRLPVKWLINCMGPVSDMSTVRQPLLQALVERRLAVIDRLKLGFDMTAAGALKAPDGKASPQLYMLGPARRGVVWEAGAVPEIRKQTFDLAKHLLG